MYVYIVTVSLPEVKHLETVPFYHHDEALNWLRKSVSQYCPGKEGCWIDTDKGTLTPIMDSYDLVKRLEKGQRVIYFSEYGHDSVSIIKSTVIHSSP